MDNEEKIQNFVNAISSSVIAITKLAESFQRALFPKLTRWERLRMWFWGKTGQTWRVQRIYLVALQRKLKENELTKVNM